MGKATPSRELAPKYLVPEVRLLSHARTNSACVCARAASRLADWAMDRGGRERRKFRRIQAPVFCRPAGLKMFSRQEETIDVSRGGVRVYSDVEMKVGDRLTLELFVEASQEVSF